MQKIATFTIGVLFLTFVGCSKENGKSAGYEGKDCSATVTFEEIVVIRDTGSIRKDFFSPDSHTMSSISPAQEEED